MANPTKDQLIAQFGTSAGDALGGISGSAVLSDEQLRGALQSTIDQIDTVAPEKGNIKVKYSLL